MDPHLPDSPCASQLVSLQVPLIVLPALQAYSCLFWVQLRSRLQRTASGLLLVRAPSPRPRLRRMLRPKSGSRLQPRRQRPRSWLLRRRLSWHRLPRKPIRRPQPLLQRCDTCCVLVCGSHAQDGRRKPSCHGAVCNIEARQQGLLQTAKRWTQSLGCCVAKMACHSLPACAMLCSDRLVSCWPLVCTCKHIAAWPGSLHTT